MPWFVDRDRDGAWRRTALPDPDAPPPRPPLHYLFGLDLGQAEDFTALVIAEQRPDLDAPLGAVAMRYDVRYIRRWRGSPYPGIVADVAGLLATPELRGRSTLLLDGTGVGRPVVDHFVLAGLDPVPVTITSGTVAERGPDHYWRVPKADLVGQVALLLQQRRLAWSRQLPEERVLAAELQNFRVKFGPTGHASYGAGAAPEWRVESHDDIVLGLSLACWGGEVGLAGRTRFF